MMSRYQGRKLSFDIFGASHAESIGVVIEGIPAGIRIDEAQLMAFMARRAARKAAYSTTRREPDKPVFTSGVKDGVTTGETLTAVIYNTDTRSKDYSQLAITPRPGHADYPAMVKYGDKYDYRGGGPFSGRMTAPWCILGAIAKSALEQQGIIIGSHILSVGNIGEKRFDAVHIDAATLQQLQQLDFATLDPARGAAMLAAIEAARADADSLGGVVEAAAVGLPCGLGGELFDGLESRLARLIFGIPAVKGLEIGLGFEAAELKGSQNNDPFYYDGDVVKTRTNNHGGLLGGITSGMPLIVRTAFKPTPSIGKPQQTVDVVKKENAGLIIHGRHDACIVPRTLPIVESCLAIAIWDELL